MLIAEILHNKGSDVVTVKPGATVNDLITLLSEHRIGAVVVSEDGVTVEGIVSERDVVGVLGARGTAALGETVGSVCTRAVVTASPNDRLDELMRLMTDGRFRHVPVVVDGRLQGIVSIGDVVKARIAQLEVEQQALTGYITSGG
jgi:CBS domain-containing protein